MRFYIHKIPIPTKDYIFQNIGSVHANLLMSGIFETDGEKNVPLEVKFSCEQGGETRDIIEHLTIPKVDNVSNY